MDLLHIPNHDNSEQLIDRRFLYLILYNHADYHLKIIFNCIFITLTYFDLCKSLILINVMCFTH